MLSSPEVLRVGAEAMSVCVFSITRNEFLHIVRDPRTLAVMFLIPIVQLLLLGYAATTDVKHLPTTTLDQDRTLRSRQLAEAYRPFEYLDIIATVGSEAEMALAVDSGRVLTAMAIVREWAQCTIEELIVTPIRPLELIIGKVAPYVVIALFASDWSERLLLQRPTRGLEMSYVYMRVLESAPQRYERGMGILTLGRLVRVWEDIAERLNPGDRVLDLGCGTGALAIRLARQDCEVTGVDISTPMLEQAVHNVRQASLKERVTLRALGAVELNTAFGDSSFDAVVSTLVFSELSEDEIAYTLAECWRILRRGGQLLVADEVRPKSILGRIGAFFLRLPFAVVAFVLTQNTTHQVAGLREQIEGAGFRIVDTVEYLAGTLELLVAQKE